MQAQSPEMRCALFVEQIDVENEDTGVLLEDLRLQDNNDGSYFVSYRCRSEMRIRLSISLLAAAGSNMALLKDSPFDITFVSPWLNVEPAPEVHGGGFKLNMAGQLLPLTPTDAVYYDK